MILGRLFAALGTVALAAALVLPALADQTFQDVSTGPLPAPQKTLNPGQITIDYLYYPCGVPSSGRGARFNPFDARDHNGPLTPRALRWQSVRHGYDPCAARYRGRPGPPGRVPLPPEPRRIPLARHT